MYIIPIGNRLIVAAPLLFPWNTLNKPSVLVDISGIQHSGNYETIFVLYESVFPELSSIQSTGDIWWHIPVIDSFHTSTNMYLFEFPTALMWIPGNSCRFSLNSHTDKYGYFKTFIYEVEANLNNIPGCNKKVRHKLQDKFLTLRRRNYVI